MSKWNRVEFQLEAAVERLTHRVAPFIKLAIIQPLLVLMLVAVVVFILLGSLGLLLVMPHSEFVRLMERGLLGALISSALIYYGLLIYAVIKTFKEKND